MVYIKLDKILKLPPNELAKKIPKRNEVKIQGSEIESLVHNEINKLYELSDKCMAIIGLIFKNLNNDSLIVGSFVEVLAKKTTEQAIFEKNKEDYEAKFADLVKISEEIRNQKKVIEEACEKLKQSGIGNEDNINEEERNYFR